MRRNAGRRPALWLGAVAAVTLCTVPRPAEAHLAAIGLGPFYDGLVHPLITPTLLLPLAALWAVALLGGQVACRWALRMLPAGWGVASLSAFCLTSEWDGRAVTGLLALVLGVVAASGVATPRPVFILLTLATGLCLGGVAGAAVGPSGGWLALTGLAVTVMATTVLAAGHGQRFKGVTARLVLRVAGSWIAAIGLLTLGWVIHAA